MCNVLHISFEFLHIPPTIGILAATALEILEVTRRDVGTSSWLLLNLLIHKLLTDFRDDRPDALKKKKKWFYGITFANK